MNKKRLLLTLLPTSVLVIGVVLAVYFHLNKPDGKDIIVAEKDDGTTVVMIDNSHAPAKDENGNIPAANVPELTEFEETENEDTTVTAKEKDTEKKPVKEETSPALEADTQKKSVSKPEAVKAETRKAETSKPAAKKPSETTKSKASDTEPAEATPPVTAPPETEPPVTLPPETEPAATAPPETTPPETTAPETTPPKPPREEPVAPDFTVYDINGNAVKLSDYLGKPVVLNFWASWCAPCRMEMPDFNEKYLELSGEVHFLMVNVTSIDTKEDAKKVIADNGYTFPVFFDPDAEAKNAYGVTAFPTTYFIDDEGYLIAYARGAISAATLQEGIDMIR